MLAKPPTSVIPLLSSPVILAVAILLLLHSAYLTTLLHAALRQSNQSPAPTPCPVPPNTRTAPLSPPTDPSAPPDVFVYRRTRKTGSSSMLEALLTALHPLNYTALYYYDPRHMQNMVRAETLSPTPRRLLIAQHNSITRADAPTRRVVIADTVMDGYTQMTSHCRYVEKVPDCEHAMIACLRNASTRRQVSYRWAGRPAEDADTYIDLPLSSAHPALSTAVLRRAYPGVTLDVRKRNVAGSACPEIAAVRAVYRELYAPLDVQVNLLRKRLLALAAFPPGLASGVNATTAEMLDAAEGVEKVKYQLGEYKGGKSVAPSHARLMNEHRHWGRDDDGKLVVVARK